MSERYYSFSIYCKEHFHHKVYRVALDGHFTCPNRDGKIDTRGCIFCSKKGSGDFSIPFIGQDLKQEDFLYNHEKGKKGEYIAYFQAFSNTYGPIDKLEKLFVSALENEWFCGISIASRPDCFSEEIFALLNRLKKEYPHKFIWIELGLQSVHDSSAIWMRRGYSLSVFEEVVKQIKEIDIPVIVHLILGLPNEDKKAILESIDYINSQAIWGVKLQLLHYLKNTDLGDAYLENKDEFKILNEKEYVDLICACIARLRKDIVIHRISGDGNKEELLAPLWSLDKKKVLNHIHHALKERKITQGMDQEKKYRKVFVEDEKNHFSFFLIQLENHISIKALSILMGVNQYREVEENRFKRKLKDIDIIRHKEINYIIDRRLKGNKEVDKLYNLLKEKGYKIVYMELDRYISQ
ncbi:MAG: TIGR01212 family radical SAM protein [Solobacterium sp.]|nr:TIGR01212 family radical SAM protein [Solobacterium sp.]